MDCCDIFGRIGFRGYTKDDLVKPNEGAVTLSPSNIIDGRMDYNNCTYISWDKYEESPEIQIKQGDILLVKTGSSFGKCAYVDTLPQKATINPQFVTLKNIRINALYLTLVLQSSYSRKCYDEFVLGTAIPTFTQEKLSYMMVPLPSINEQERIVRNLSKWFILIEEIEKEKIEITKLINQTKSKILSLAIQGKLVAQDTTDEPAVELLKRINPAWDSLHISNYENIPKGWAECKLEDVVDYEQPQKYIVSSTSYSDNFPIPVLTAGKSFIIGHTNESNGIFTDIPVIIFDDFTTESKYVDFPFKVKSSAMKILHVKEGVNIHFIYLIMSITKLIGDTHKRYWISEYSQLPILLPPAEEQNRIVKIVEEYFSKLDEIALLIK